MSSAPGERGHRVAGVADDQDRRRCPRRRARAAASARPPTRCRCRGSTADPAPNSGYSASHSAARSRTSSCSYGLLGVGAVDRDVGVEQVRVGAVVEPAGVAVGEREDARRRRRCGPAASAWASCGQDVGVVQRRDDGGQDDARRRLAGLAVLGCCGIGVCLGLGQDGLDVAARVVAERAAGDQARAVLRRRRRSPPRSAAALGLGLGLRVDVGVDGGVEHQRAHLVGEQLGVGRAERGAVGVAEVGELLVAEGLAEPVHVAGGVDGVEGAQRVAVLARRSPSATSSASAKASSSCSAVVGRGSAATIRSFISSGMHSTGVDRPTPRGSKPTTSNRLQHLLGQRQREADRGVGAGAARAAGVDHQRADPVGLAGQHGADEEQRQRGALGLVVADRHLGAAALEGEVALAAGLVGDERLDLRRRSRSTRSSAASGSAGSVASAASRTRRRRCPRTRCSRTARRLHGEQAREDGRQAAVQIA